MTPLVWIAGHIVALVLIALVATRHDMQDKPTAVLCGLAAALNLVALIGKIVEVAIG